MVRERLGKASVILLIVSLFIQPILVKTFNIPDGISAIISAVCFIVTIILASFSKGIVRVMVLFCTAIIVIPFGTHLDI